MPIIPDRLRLKSLPVYALSGARKSSSEPSLSRRQNIPTPENSEDTDLEHGYLPWPGPSSSPGYSFFPQSWESLFQFRAWKTLLRRRTWKRVVNPRTWRVFFNFRLFRPRIDKKLFDPASCRAINYRMRKSPSIMWCLGRFLFFFAFTLGISIWHSNPNMWLPFETPEDGGKQLRFMPILQTFVVTGVSFLTAVGQFRYSPDFPQDLMRATANGV